MDAQPLDAKTRRRAVDALARRFGIDARALAVFRISLGLLLLADLLLRSRNLVAFYTDAGLLPRATLRAEHPLLADLSLHALSGAAWVQALLFVVAAGFALALVLGYRTRLVTAVSLLLLISLQARNPLVLNGGDSLLRRLLFWGLFLPLGGRWSVDALRHGRAPRRVASVASAALLLQLVFVYVVNAAFKLRGDLWLGGDAVRYVFSLGQFVVLFGHVLAHYPALLRLFDWLWLAMVTGSVLLVLLTGRSRAAFVSLFVAMHLGMLLTLQIGLFPLVVVAGLLPFLPGFVWDALPVPSVGGRVLRTFDRALPSVPGDGFLALAALARPARRLVPVVVVAALVLAAGWNAASLGYLAVPAGPGGNVAVTPSNYGWDMFAPEPMHVDGWFVAPGRLQSGGRVDALHLTPVRWGRPPDVARSYPSARWRKYLVNLRRRGDPALERGLADYLCGRWNADHANHLTNVSVVFVAQPTRLDAPEPTHRIDLWNQSCPTTSSVRSHDLAVTGPGSGSARTG